MDSFSYIFAGVMVYLAVIIFILGMSYQIYYWFISSKTRIKTGIFPKPKGRFGIWSKTLTDSFLFPQVIKTDPWIWSFTILFHFALLGAFIGHLRLIQEFTPLILILGQKGMDKLGLWGGGVMGIILTVTLIYLFIRRLAFPYREVSVSEDYFLLILLILIVLVGNYMRFFGDIHTVEYRAYLQSLISLRPDFPEAISNSKTKWALVLHVLLANILLIYFPFSKLIHMVATFPSNLTKRV